MRVVATLIRLLPPAEDFGAEMLRPPGESRGEAPVGGSAHVSRFSKSMRGSTQA